MTFLALALAAITITVQPATCLAPCNFRVVLTVERAPDNAMVVLEVGAHDSAYYARSDMQWDGQSAKRTIINYSQIPAGTYAVLATLYTRDGKTHTDMKRVLIVGEGTQLKNR